MSNSQAPASSDAAFDLDHLLALPASAAHVSYLQAIGLLSEQGLLALLQTATELTSRDPARARQLAEICEQVASEIDVPIIAARAAYIRARTHLLNAEFEIALELIARARQGFITSGNTIEAMRTYVGQIHVLQQLGRYALAVSLGQQALAELKASDAPEQQHITAMLHQNLGLCYREIGQYAEALTEYTEGERLYRALDDSEGAGAILNNRGMVLLDLGRAADALADFEQATRIFAHADFAIELANATNNVGYAHLLLGQATLGLAAYEHARTILQPLAASAEKQALLLDVAEAYLSLNLYPEAGSAYREVSEALQTSGMRHERARALWGLGTVLTAQTEWDEAEQALSAAALLFQQANNAPALSSVMLDQAALRAAIGNRGDALDLAQGALVQVAQQQLPFHQAQAHLRIAQLLLPDAAAAQTHLLVAQNLIEAMALPSLQHALLRQMGHTQRLLGQNDEAERLLHQAIQAIEHERATLVQERLRVSFLHDKLGAYDDLILLYLERGDEASVRRAFALSEQARSRTLGERMADRAIPKPADHATPTADEMAQARALQVQLHNTYNDLLQGNQTDEEQAALHAQAMMLEQQLSRLQLQQQASAPNSAHGQLGTIVSLTELQQQLPSKGLLLSYYVIEDEIFAFGLNGDDKTHVRVAQLGHASVVIELLERLALQWERFGEGHAFVTRNMPLMLRSTQAVLAGLYAELIQPIRTWLRELQGSDTPLPLIIVPHGALHQVPFHALFDGTRHLIDFCELSYAPSASVIALCQRRPAITLQTPLVMGLPDAQIPLAVQEAQAVAQILNADQAVLDAQAKLDTFYLRAPQSDVIHLACHGLFRDDNPLFSSLKLHNGWLMAADIAHLNLQGALVTLSACESGRSHVEVGDEAMGLARAFLSAGASTLVASLWLAHDEATTQLMSSWYQAIQANMPLTAALRQAQLMLKQSHPHPFYWAPFILVGKR